MVGVGATSGSFIALDTYERAWRVWTHGAHFYASHDTYMGMPMCSCASVASVEISDGLLRDPRAWRKYVRAKGELTTGALKAARVSKVDHVDTCVGRRMRQEWRVWKLP